MYLVRHISDWWNMMAHSRDEVNNIGPNVSKTMEKKWQLQAIPVYLSSLRLVAALVAEAAQVVDRLR